jgi:hypothetical protein
MDAEDNLPEAPVEAPMMTAEGAAAPVVVEAVKAAEKEADAPLADGEVDDTLQHKVVRQCTYYQSSSQHCRHWCSDMITLVEFYFSDSNLPYDKFMWTLHTANAEHWVPLATVSSFKRTRELTGKRGIEWVATALRNRSDQLEVDDTGAQVRRKTEVTEPKDQFSRSVYAVSHIFHTLYQSKWLT